MCTNFFLVGGGLTADANTKSPNLRVQEEGGHSSRADDRRKIHQPALLGMPASRQEFHLFIHMSRGAHGSYGRRMPATAAAAWSRPDFCAHEVHTVVSHPFHTCVIQHLIPFTHIIRSWAGHAVARLQDRKVGAQA
eukprot:260941-Chlamydomonas_euryale.AAC.5